MKKAIALAVAMTAAAGANAAWTPGNVDTTNGELILSVWNYDNSTSFAVDLGIDTWEMLTGSVSPQVIQLDQEAIDFIGGSSSSILWNIAGANNNFVSSGAPLPETYGMYFTSSVFPTTNPAFGTFNTQYTKFEQYYNIQSQFGVATAASAGSEDETLMWSGTQYAGQAWGTSMGNLNAVFGGYSTAAGDLETLAAYSYQAIDTNLTLAMSEDLNQWTLDLTAGTLTYGAVSEVPVPAAAWLFGSALMSLVAVRRRRAA